jgi:pimeloyl-ACP methyl ester carboxylesterase
MAGEPYTTAFVTSKDGTTIGYRQLGAGPGVVLLHGAMESAQSHMHLARALSDAFTVYLPDRRGRGLSGPYRQAYSIQTDVDDLDALVTRTGAHNVFGVSSGGIICLQAGLTLPAVHKVAIYEPALFLDDAVPAAFLARFDQEMAQGRLTAALVTAMQGAQMGPAIFTHMPRWLLERLTHMALKGAEKKGSGETVAFKALAPTLHYDFQLVVEKSGKLESFRGMRADVLLLGGSKSPGYLKAALDAMEKVLPQAKRIEFPGLDHGGSSDISDMNRGGKPELVAQELRRFFA